MNRTRVVAGVAGSLLACGLLAVLIARQAGSVGNALDRVSWPAFIALIVPALIGLALRTEAWVVALRAAGGDLRRNETHAASALTYVANIASPYVGGPVRMIAVRRLAPDRAPRIGQLVAADAALLYVEAVLVAGLVLAMTWTLDLRWYVPAGLCLLVVASGGALSFIGRRWQHRPSVRGLAILGNPRARMRVLLLLAGVSAANLIRTWLALDAVGLSPSAAQATAVFVGTGLLGLLPVGTLAAGAGAPLVVFSSDSVGAAAAAGIVLGGTMFAASLIYAGICAWILFGGRGGRFVPVRRSHAGGSGR